MRRAKKNDMTGQLLLPFVWTDQTKDAERILQKYLRVADNVAKFYEWCFDAPAKDQKRCMRMYYAAYDRLQRAGQNMMIATGLPLAWFSQIEQDWADETQKRNCDKIKAQRLLEQLDGFGYIQQVFDRENRTEERYVEEGEEFDPDNCEGYENGRPIGYWYWLFEEAVAQIPIPVEILNKYIDKYGKK